MFIVNLFIVYFSWPEPNAPPVWQLLGFLTNVKVYILNALPAQLHMPLFLI